MKKPIEVESTDILSVLDEFTTYLKAQKSAPTVPSPQTPKPKEVYYLEKGNSAEIYLKTADDILDVPLNAEIIEDDILKANSLHRVSTVSLTETKFAGEYVFYPALEESYGSKVIIAQDCFVDEVLKAINNAFIYFPTSTHLSDRDSSLVAMSMNYDLSRPLKLSTSPNSNGHQCIINIDELLKEIQQHPTLSESLDCAPIKAALVNKLSPGISSFVTKEVEKVTNTNFSTQPELIAKIQAALTELHTRSTDASNAGISGSYIFGISHSFDNNTHISVSLYIQKDNTGFKYFEFMPSIKFAVYTAPEKELKKAAYKKLLADIRNLSINQTAINSAVRNVITPYLGELFTAAVIFPSVIKHKDKVVNRSNQYKFLKDLNRLKLTSTLADIRTQLKHLVNVANSNNSKNAEQLLGNLALDDFFGLHCEMLNGTSHMQFPYSFTKDEVAELQDRINKQFNRITTASIRSKLFKRLRTELGITKPTKN